MRLKIEKRQKFYALLGNVNVIPIIGQYHCFLYDHSNHMFDKIHTSHVSFIIAVS